MPMIWTHILFSEEVIDQTEKIVNFSLDEDYLLLGAQGDNLLEFTPFWSENKLSANRKPLKLIIKNSEENFLKLIKSIPYTNQNKNNIKTSYYSLLMHQYHNLDTRKIPVLKEFKLGLFIDKDIKKTLYIINPYLAKNLQKSYLHTLISLKWFFDPNGWKANLFPSYTPLF